MTLIRDMNIRGLILDMDGVLWRDQQAIGDLPRIFRTIDELNLKVTLATNNATLNAEKFLEKLNNFGVVLELWQIVTSSQATAEYLVKHHPGGGPLYIIGEEGLVNSLSIYSFYHDETHPMAVVIGLDRQLTYQQLSQASLLVRSGIPFIGTNPDKTLPTPRGLIPGAGSILAAVETATDRKPILIGKPAPEMYRIAIKRMGIREQETLVVGDRVETDIVGAQALDCRTALVLSGATSYTAANAWRPPPDLICADLEQVLAFLQVG